MLRISVTGNARRRLVQFAVAASLAAAVPIGIASAPAGAAPMPPDNHPWQQDCDHTGNFGMQTNRGMPQWGDCDVNGHWQVRDHGQWQWHRDRDRDRDRDHDRDGMSRPPAYPGPQFPPPLAGLFGSS